MVVSPSRTFRTDVGVPVATEPKVRFRLKTEPSCPTPTTASDPKQTPGSFAVRMARMMGHANIQVQRADHVGFAVASLDESLRFWVDGLGARLVRTGEMGGEFLGQVTGAHGARVRLAIVWLADQTIELLEYQGLDRPNPPAKPFDPGFAHLALVVDDIDALLARIAAYGWKAQGTPQTIASGARAGTRVIYAVGPDGATIEFMQPPLVTATTDPTNRGPAFHP